MERQKQIKVREKNKKKERERSRFFVSISRRCSDRLITRNGGTRCRKWRRRGFRKGGTVWKTRRRLSYPERGRGTGFPGFKPPLRRALPSLPPFCHRSRWKGRFTGCHRLFNRPWIFSTGTHTDFDFRESWYISWIKGLIWINIWNAQLENY